MIDDEIMQDQEIENTFAAINQAKYEMSIAQLISNHFPEMIDFELNMYLKAYMYDYNAVHYGLNHEILPDMINPFVGNILKYLKENKDTTDIIGCKTVSLKDKCLLCIAWNPTRFCDDEYSFDNQLYKYIGIKSYKLDFLNEQYRSYGYYYLKNLNIIYVSNSGNHRLLLQALQNNNIEAKVHEYDDIELLKNFYTDGGYLINKRDSNIKVLIPNYRFAIIFRLTQLKLGLN